MNDLNLESKVAILESRIDEVSKIATLLEEEKKLLQEEINGLVMKLREAETYIQNHIPGPESAR